MNRMEAILERKIEVIQKTCKRGKREDHCV